MTSYTDSEIIDQTFIRTFIPDDESKFVWHRDKENRLITILEGKGWKLQYDNELPRSIEAGNTFFVPKLMYHRLIMGTTELKIKIEENK